MFRQFDRPQPPTVYGYRVMARYPHDTNAFTEGLQIYNGALYESTGLEGRSFIAKRDLRTSQIQKRVNLEPQYFGEGIVIFDGKLYQLTWKHETGFIYDAESFKRVGHFAYKGEGWALTHDGESLIMSNGSSTLSFLDPKTLKVRRTINVTLMGQPRDQLNELEWVKGEIYANVWQSDYIVRINPKTGAVTGVIDLTGLLPNQADVLNGIAYDAKNDRLYVTGKLWKYLFEIKLVKRAS